VTARIDVSLISQDAILSPCRNVSDAGFNLERAPRANVRFGGVRRRDGLNCPRSTTLGFGATHSYSEAFDIERLVRLIALG
jgi:hypothetical protein